MAYEQSSNLEISGYLPRTIINWYQESESEDVHQVSELTGVLACIDASGFTALTRMLSEKGVGGPEYLTNILNSFFDSFCAAVFRHRGDVLKFAGDALWAYFPEGFDPGLFFADALRGMKELNASEELLSQSPLTVHIGAESGTFLLASLGIESTRLEAEPHGSLVQTVYELCGVAGENDMVIGGVFAKQSNHKISGDGLPANCYRVIAGKETTPVSKGQVVNRPVVSRSRFLSSYIPSELLGRLRSADGDDHLSSEHRSVTVLFANFDLASSHNHTTESDELVALNSKIIEAFTLIRNLGGTIARIDPFEPGHKLLVLFGAPRKQADDELRALSCARELLALGDGSFNIRVGLSLGSLFCGDVGASERREYTVMGEAANTAARLMAKSRWGELLLDDQLREKLPTEVRTTALFFALKGMGDNVRCHKLTDVTEATNRKRDDIKIVGLKEELTTLRQLWETVLSGESRTLAIVGNTGSGKTTLCQLFANEYGPDKVTFFSCSQSVLFGHGWLARKIIELPLLRSELSSREQFTDAVSDLVGEKWMPLFSKILGVDIPENEWTTGLSAPLRLSKTKELFNAVVSGLTSTPTAIILDDYDKADEFSKQLIAALMEESLKAPLLIVALGRERMIGSQFDTFQVEILEVNNPSTELWWKFFDARFEHGKRERELFEKLLLNTQRNPHCVMDFLRRSLEREYLSVNSATGKWELVDLSAEIKLPQSVNDVNLEQFDCLAESQRRLLKVAAVAGTRFNSETVSKVIEEDDTDKTLAVFEQLSEIGILSGQKGSDQFSFVHASMVEAIYSCLSLADKLRLHKSFARLGENQLPPANPAILANHYFRAECPKPAFTYSLRAASAAAKLFSLTEAAGHFRRCRDILEAQGDSLISPDELFEFYREQTKSLVSEGKYAKAFRVLREWRKTARRHGVTAESVTPLLETAKIVFKQSRYQRGRRIIESVLNSSFVNSHPEFRSIALSILAEIERRTGNFSGARLLCQQAIDLVGDQKDGTLLVDAHNKLGLALWGEGDLSQAARQFESSLKLAGNGNSMYARAQTTNNLAIVHWEQGDFKTAAKLLGESSGIFTEIGDRRNEAYSVGNLASLHRISGEFKKSEQLFLRADSIFERLKDEHAHQYTLGNLGDIDLIRGRFARAEEKFSLASEFAQKVGDSELEAECKVRFGDLAFFRREMPEADQLYQDAAKKAKSIGSNEYYLRASLGLARLNIYRRDHHVAANYIREVIEVAGESRSILFEREAEFLIGEQHRVTESLSLASDCYQTVLKYALSQNVFELILKSAVRIAEVDSEQFEYAKGILVSLAKQFIGENDPDAWSELADSGYFSFFNNTIERLFASKEITKQLALSKSI